MSSNLPVYQSSGRLHPALLLAVPAMLPLIGLLALAYAYLAVYIPLVGYVNVLLAGFFALGLGLATVYALKLGRCRSPRAGAAVGTLIGALGLYVSWVAFERALLGRADAADMGLFDLMTSPSAVWNLARLIGDSGWYSIQGMTPSGVVLWAFWVLEALVLLSVPTLMGHMLSSDEVYCEGCGRWAEKEEGLLQLAPEGAGDLFEALESGSPRGLRALPAADPAGAAWLRLDLESCSCCDELHALTVVGLVTRDDGRGESREVESKLIERVLLDVSLLDELDRLADRRRGAESASEPSAALEGSLAT